VEDQDRQAPPMIKFGRYRWHWPAALSALSYYNYRLFWFGQLISLTGMWMQQTAQQWLVFRLTGSAFQLSVVAFATFFPLLLLSPLAGVFVDRVDKRKLVTICQVLFMLLAGVLAVLTYTGAVQFWHIAILALLLGVVDAFEKPARQTLLVLLVGPRDLMNAIALHASVFNIARFIGPATAGVIVARAGEAATFAINAFTFLPVIAGLMALRLVPSVLPKVNSSSIEQLTEGVRYVIHDRLKLILMCIVGVFAFFGLPYIVLMPVFAGEVLNVGPEGFGAMFSAAGIGAIIGGVSLAMMSQSQRKGLLVTVAMIVFSAATIVFSSSRWMPLSLVMLALMGWAQLSLLATTNSLLQTLTPDGLRGRVISIFLWMHGGPLPLGSLFLGALAQRWGVSYAVMLGGLICGLFALFVIFRFPALRHINDSRPDELP
jgi:MFS family permease